MEQTQIIRKDNKILFSDDEIGNVFKAHGLSLNEQTKDLLSKGEWSDFLEDIKLDQDTHKHGKIKLNREKDGTVKVNYQFHQEQLVIPKKIGDHVLTEDDKLKLNNNEIVGPIKYENNDLYIRVDPDLNAVTVRTAKEISIPNVIGHNTSMKFEGYTLTDQDKNKLANGGALSTKLFCGKDGYFTANFAITEDKKGVVFTNIHSVPLHNVKELEAKFNLPKSDLVDNVINAGNRSVVEKQETTILENVTHSSNNVIADNPKSAEIHAVSSPNVISKDYLSINDHVIRNEFKNKLACNASEIQFVVIGEGVMNGFDKASIHGSLQDAKSRATEFKNVELEDNPLKYSIHVIDEKKLPDIESYHGDDSSWQEAYKKEIISSTKEYGILIVPEISPNLEKEAQSVINDKNIEHNPIKDNSLNNNLDLSREFTDAVDKHDFKKLNELSERGWKPSDEEIKGLDKKNHLTPNDKIAVKSIFSIENKPEVSASSNKSDQKNKLQVKFHSGLDQKKSSGRGKKAKDVINRAFNDM